MKVVWIAVTFLLLLAAPAPGEEIRGECDIRFLGTSTLHDFTGTARCQPFSVDPARKGDGGKSIAMAEVSVPVDEMNTGNKDRDMQMREMFRSERFPMIRGYIRNIGVDAFRRRMAKEGKVTFDLDLRIRDVEKTVTVTATDIREEGEQVRFDFTFPVSLRDFGLKAPSFLFIVRVGDRIVVTGNVRLEVSSKE
ncbi:MAG: YceI family protein [Candidatus Deferrimicrobiaceae bacterium]